MAYIDGFVLAVPAANKQEFIEHAEFVDQIIKDFGADRIVECWADDVPDGEVTDFRRAVKAKDDEIVVFAWIEWPDKETRDTGMKKMQEHAKDDERWDPEKYPPP
ncbi:MAG: DUF1428 domain-containing protein, partial [Gammaproteobacteria bacterium]|nr:DUF1428 domain-containing protein [Gammaproteobacteria bacterium]